MPGAETLLGFSGLRQGCGGRHGRQGWETGLGDMDRRHGRQDFETWIGDRDKRLRNVVFDILTRTTTYWDINRTTKKANVHKNMFFFQ